MSAPLVVNTKDGACWTRRTVTEGGIALYALADVCSCPEFVMATLDELAARGIVGSADVLPVPAGPVSQGDPVAAGRRLDLLALMDERAASVVSPCLAAVLDEAERLRAEVAELKEQRERRRVRLVALQNDALSMRGSLSPNGQERKVPFPLGETLTPAVDWLIARVAELEALTPAEIQTCRVCGAGYTYGQPCSTCEFRKRMAAEVSARATQLEDPHDSPLHHRYETGRDLPETGGAS